MLDAERCKHAQIETNPKGFFVHVRVPEHVAERLRVIQRDVLPSNATPQEIDHITLVYTKKALEDHPPEKVHAALETMRQHGETTSPIDARLQGWAYFDGASKDDKPATALVALVDAPGLEHLHVDLARALTNHGIEPSKAHAFTPHITLGYLPQHGRAEKSLPPIDATFSIDAAHVASRDHHEIPLTGRAELGLKAAAAAWRDHLQGGKADDKKPSDFDGKQLAKGRAHEHEHTKEGPLATEIAMDHLAEDPKYYDKLDKIEKSAGLPPGLRNALLGGGVGAGLGALAGMIAPQQQDQSLARRVLLPAAMGAVGGSIAGAAHAAGRPAAVDYSLGEQAAMESLK